MLDRGYSPGQRLDAIAASMLLQDLGIADFLNSDQHCQRSGPTYSPSVEGWKTG